MSERLDNLQAGIADAIPSLAMEPGIRTINGFQAVCFARGGDESHWRGDDRIPYIEGEVGMMTWLGSWSELYIDAKIEAVAHNLVHHSEEAS